MRAVDSGGLGEWNRVELRGVRERGETWVWVGREEKGGGGEGEEDVLDDGDLPRVWKLSVVFNAL